ncbi:prephenate dehydrogenase [Actinotignum schaalii]|uniref:prephenate dehydrogenase n=1 Tax=Actinotignum schaalii TaxID=59505 RepID=UPI00041FD6AD|nr:prephenate dehydrogenase [Actinotignum schaalii]AIE82259.1 prephenate dehydrogenase [Actinotignum schaalii]WQN45974.1 prephenate dehydrogenase [Actinotignum schaalii]
MHAGPILIIGSGLLGASLGLRLRLRDIPVYLEDSSPLAAALARDLGAGEEPPEGDWEPSLVVVAVPPDVTAQVVSAALDRFPAALVTDVASVKAVVADRLAAHPARERYLGCHPMAGRERSGAIAADADLFEGRPWVICPRPETREEDIARLRSLALDCGAMPILVEASAHDRAVALVSHVPQLVSSLLAGTLNDAAATELSLAGQGLRDMTRLAHSDPQLWTAIIACNCAAVAPVLRDVAERTARLASALEAAAGAAQAPGLARAVAAVVAAGGRGVARIPGKHGGAPQRYTEVTVLVPDRPGELGRLFTEVGEIGVNIEDFSLEHSVAQKVGRARLSVAPAAARDLSAALAARQWQAFIEGGEHE